MKIKTIPSKVLPHLLSEKVKVRFLRFVNKRSENECWNWNGRMYGRTGRGEYRCRKNGIAIRLYSHRAAWILANKRDVPKGLQVLHSCNNPLCCNPNHLRAGTQLDNLNQMRRQGRDNFKFTDNEIQRMRKLHCSGIKIRKLMSLFKISYTHIYAVIARRTRSVIFLPCHS